MTERMGHIILHTSCKKMEFDIEIKMMSREKYAEINRIPIQSNKQV